ALPGRRRGYRAPGGDSIAFSPPSSVVPESRELLADEEVGHALEPIAQDAGQVQEHARSDPRVAPLDAGEEALVDGEHVDPAHGHDVCAALVLAHQRHLTEHVAAAELGDHAPLLALTGDDVDLTAQDHVHLIALLALADDRVAGTVLEH